MRCGNCKANHETVLEVRDCYKISRPITVLDQGWRADPATKNQRNFLNNLRKQNNLPAIPDEQGLTKGQATQDIDHWVKLAESQPKVVRPRTAWPEASIEEEDEYLDRGQVRKVTDGTRPSVDIPAGHYAVASLTGNNDLDFFRVDRPTEGRWAGRTYVKRVVGGKPDSKVFGKTGEQVLQAIWDAGIGDSAKLYGTELGQCSRCNRHLTDELSRSLGIGPDCRNK
jgi:hypothetical protein